MGKAEDKRVCRPRRPHHSVGRTAPALAVERTPWTPRFGCLRLPRSLIDCITTLMGLPSYYHGSTVANIPPLQRCCRYGNTVEVAAYFRSTGATKTLPQQWGRKQYLGCKTILPQVLGLHWVFQQQRGCTWYKYHIIISEFIVIQDK